MVLSLVLRKRSRSGGLVSQTSATYTSNGSYDTTTVSHVDVAVSGDVPVMQTKSVSYTPTESAQTQTVTPDTGYDGLSSVAVSVGAISDTYVGSGITRRDDDDLTASGPTVSVPAGYYESSASKAVASGTAGTPTATKGTVSNHSVSVTPSVTNSAGYISSETKTGTAVTVSASELVSGTKSITANGTGIDVTDYAAVDVNVPNSYTEGDEGKVVSSGALVAQTSRNITENGTYDTTLNDEVVVNVSGGGGGNYSEVISLINGTFTGALSNNDITAVPDGFCSGTRNQGITSVSLPNCTAVGASGFYQRQYLSSINLPLCATIGNMAFGYSGGSANPHITILVFPSLTKCGMQAFRNMTYLTTFDTLGGTASNAWDTNVFVACSSLNTLILRQTSGVSPISNINFLASTPFASGGTGGTLYVPASLISSYQSATNWSTILGYANNSIVAIEGSQYENYYADGTPIS